MPQPVLIFAADELRGGIIREILKRGGFEPLLFKNILGAGDVISKHAPPLVIFDTSTCFPEEMTHLKNLCGILNHTAVILLGDPAVMSSFQGPVIRQDLCLSDPLNPALIVEKAKQVSAETRQVEGPGGKGLEDALKDFLRLQ